jgi:hypothetical protein
LVLHGQLNCVHQGGLFIKLRWRLTKRRLSFVAQLKKHDICRTHKHVKRQRERERDPSSRLIPGFTCSITSRTWSALFCDMCAVPNILSARLSLSPALSRTNQSCTPPLLDLREGWISFVGHSQLKYVSSPQGGFAAIFYSFL